MYYIFVSNFILYAVISHLYTFFWNLILACMSYLTKITSTLSSIWEKNNAACWANTNLKNGYRVRSGIYSLLNKHYWKYLFMPRESFLSYSKKCLAVKHNFKIYESAVTHFDVHLFYWNKRQKNNFRIRFIFLLS